MKGMHVMTPSIKTIPLVGLILALGLVHAQPAPAWGPTLPENFPNGVRVPTLDETYPNFVVRDGDTARLERVFEKGLNGEPLTVAVIGGSITSGAHSGTRERQWGYVLTEWFRHVFPKSRVEYVNAGIGATGSGYGVYRVERDVCAKGADVVGVEFAVNDPNIPVSTEYNEGLVRHLLASEKQPFVFQLSMVHKTRDNSQNRQLEVSTHYDIPHFSFRDAFLPLFESGKLTHRELAKDELHPNEIGHPYMAALVCRYLNLKLAAYLAAKRAPRTVPALPEKPLVGHTFDTGRVVALDEAKIVENRGFELGVNAKARHLGKVLVGTNAGDRVTFEIDAPTCAILYYKINGPMGRAKVSIDGETSTMLDGWFEKTWGGYTQLQLLWRDRPGRHLVTFEILEETSDKVAGGHRFEISALLMTEAR